LVRWLAESVVGVPLPVTQPIHGVTHPLLRWRLHQVTHPLLRWRLHQQMQDQGLGGQLAEWGQDREVKNL
jgi:hypothetical protein